MARTPKYSLKQIEKALRTGGGVYALAAKALTDPVAGTTCSPNTIKAAVARSPRLKALKLELLDGHLDTAEAKLFSKIREGNMTAIIFFLKTHGKGRGYIERHVTEVTGAGGGPVLVGDAAKLAEKVKDLSPEQIRALAGVSEDDLAPVEDEDSTRSEADTRSE